MGRDILSAVAEFGREKGLFDTENIIVGLSGGPDSVALLTILTELADKTKAFPKIYAIHVNHNLRKEAKDDEALARKCCERLGVPCKIVSVDVKGYSAETGRSEEESGRILRYKAFDDYSRQLLGDDFADRSRIAVAHHKGDLAETMMMNLFRGSGLEGLVSPAAVNGRIIRPLLVLSKEEIIDFLDSRGIEYATDATNLMSDCTRNIWRNELLPAIDRVSIKPAMKALSDTYSLLATDLDFLKQMTDETYEHIVIENTVSDFVYVRCDDLRSCHRAVGGRVMRRMWEKTFGDLVDFESLHMEKVFDLIGRSGATERSLDLGRGRCAVTATGYLTFCKATDRTRAMCGVARLMGLAVSYDDLSIPLKDIKNANLPKTELHIKSLVVENIGALEYNDLSWVFPMYAGDDREILLTNGLPEAVFKRAGGNSSKKLHDLLADYKVPRSARTRVVVAVSGGEVLWIPGIGHAEGFTGTLSQKAWAADPGHPGKAERFIQVTMDYRDGTEC